MEINWTLLSYVVIALFGMVGFYRGWWREAIVFVFLAVLIFLLLNPDVAQWVIEQVNAVIAFIWNLIPVSITAAISSTIDKLFAVNTVGGPPQINPTDGSTWIMILVLFMVIANLLGRALLGTSLSRSGIQYAPTCLGSIFGGLLGAINGLIILNLIREYLDGRNLPGGALPTDISQTTGTVGVSASTFALKISDIPQFTILDSFIPWIFVGAGGLLTIILLRNRVRFVKSAKGYRKVDQLTPYGYRELDVKAKG